MDWTFAKYRRRKPDVVIGDDYLRRWWLIPKNRFFTIYLHQINKSDDDRALHDHPSWSISVVLQGGYDEVLVNKTVRRKAGQIIIRKGSCLHRLIIPEDKPAVTLFMMGPRYRPWGFACPNGSRPWQIFCSPTDSSKTGRGCE